MSIDIDDNITKKIEDLILIRPLICWGYLSFFTTSLGALFAAPKIAYPIAS